MARAWETHGESTVELPGRAASGIEVDSCMYWNFYMAARPYKEYGDWRGCCSGSKGDKWHVSLSLQRMVAVMSGPARCGHDSGHLEYGKAASG